MDTKIQLHKIQGDSELRVFRKYVDRVLRLEDSKLCPVVLSLRDRTERFSSLRIPEVMHMRILNKYTSEFHTYSVPTEDYLRIFYRSIEGTRSSSELVSGSSVEGLDYVLYKESGTPLECTGKILVDIPRNRVLTSKGYLSLETTKGLTELKDVLMGNLERSECKAISVLVYITGLKVKGVFTSHVNVIFLIKAVDGIGIFAYEPTGSEASKGAMEEYYITRLISKIASTDRRLVVLPSMTLGLQEYCEDKIGHCVMFSYFWVYCFLGILPLIHTLSFTLSDIFSVLNITENILVIIYTHSVPRGVGRVYSVVQAFMFRLSQAYVEEFSRDGKTMERIEGNFERYIQSRDSVGLTKVPDPASACGVHGAS